MGIGRKHTAVQHDGLVGAEGGCLSIVVQHDVLQGFVILAGSGEEVVVGIDSIEIFLTHVLVGRDGDGLAVCAQRTLCPHVGSVFGEALEIDIVAVEAHLQLAAVGLCLTFHPLVSV